jgi:pyruvate dehydrogenase E2 component (dihydrolipoamide acetyltransferase)
MASDVIVPEVGELGMEVTFVRWLKAAGDQVAVGDPLFEVDTEKSVMVVEAYSKGVLVDLAAKDGDLVAPRQVIARLLAPDEPLTSTIPPVSVPAHPSSIEPERPSGAVASSAGPAVDPGSEGSEDVPARAPRSSMAMSPRARRVAKELGADPATIRGTGPDGIITEADVRAAVSPPAAAHPHPPAQEPSLQLRSERARRAIAELTSSSWRSIPHFFLQLDADVEDALGLAKPTPLICAAVAQALSRHGECNLRWEGDTPVPRDTVDLGLLVDSPKGLLITVLADAQDMDLADMADAVRDAAERGRRGKLGAIDMRPRSLTVSNLGMYPVDRFTAVIPAPDILTLAVGRTRTVPRWDGGSFLPRRVMGLSLSVDHRALDGAAAARFMATLEEVLSDPAAAGLA